MSAAPALVGTVLHVGSRRLETRHGDFVVHLCRDLTRRTYLLVLGRGDLGSSEPLLARVHSSCVTSETYAGCDCDCAEQLDAALAAIAAAGRGVVFYLDQEGRGAGFVAKVRDRMLVQASGGRLSTFDAYAQMGLASDVRSYEGVAAACGVLGIGAPLRLLTNNPEKLAALATLGVSIAGSVTLALPPSPFNRHYLAAKAAAGHRLDVTHVGHEAEPPERVEVTAPQMVPETPNLVDLGFYWLPIRPRTAAASLPHWFRLHAYVDLASGREHVVLAYGDRGATPVLLRFQREALLERVPGSALGVEQRRWDATVRAFVAHGSGIAIMLADQSCRATFGIRAAEADDATMVALARRHVGGRRVLPLVDPRVPLVDSNALQRNSNALQRDPNELQLDAATDASAVDWIVGLSAAGIALGAAHTLAVA